MALAEHVDQLRRLAAADPDTTLLQLAILNMLEDQAVAVDQLRGDPDQRDPGRGRGFGSI